MPKAFVVQAVRHRPLGHLSVFRLRLDSKIGERSAVHAVAHCDT